MTAIQSVLFGVEQTAQTSDDCYTPPHVFESLGLEFDLDVCAPPGGAPAVPCKRFFTMVDDGLSQDWEGRVWMNPPYSNSTPWVRRFIEHGNGVALLPMCKSNWINAIFSSAHGVCIGPGGGEMRFLRPGAEPLRIGSPVFFAAIGDGCVEALHNIGTVRVRHDHH